MATYAEKIAKYRARVRECVELGIDPRESDVIKLMHHVGRAEKKGKHHKTRTGVDKIKAHGKVLKSKLPELLERAGRVLAG